MAEQPNTPVEMFNELIRQGYVTPVSEYPNLSMPTILRSVPSVYTAGTASVGTGQQGGATDAELDSGSQGDQRD
jgi:hypothetical protein